MDQSSQLRYSPSEVKEFEDMLFIKSREARKELENLKASILQKSIGGDDNGRLKSLEDGADSFEKEYLNQLAARTQKYLMEIEDALVRVKNGTFGICVQTGKLISKERLRIVPHTKYSVEAKLSKA